MNAPIDRRLSVAPMMDWTDRHCRYFLRQISQHTLLYTEMITTGALLYGDRNRFLQFDAAEHPIAIQLGGSDPTDLATCAKMAEDYGYDEVNLNVGCPSDRVQSGAFGLCLMNHPQLVANCVHAMKTAVKIPVTVKTRLGVDDNDSDEALHAFVALLQQAGVDHVCIHARKGWLKGLSPKENRDVPPLQYERAYQLKQAFPTLNIGINGGIETLEQTQHHLQHLDAVMIGRAAYHDSYLLAGADQAIFGGDMPIQSREQIIERMLPYIEREMANGAALKHIVRHMLNLFKSCPGAKHWRRHLSTHAHLPNASIGLIHEALVLMQDAAPDDDTTA